MLAANANRMDQPRGSHESQHRMANEQVQTAVPKPVIDAYSRHGGVATAEEVSLLMRRHCEQPISQLARWIVGSDIVHVSVQGQTWIPLFQFHLDDMSIRPSVTALVSELAPVMDNHQLAAWFAEPSDWLSGASPLEAIDVDFPAVRKAARTDRFVVSG